VFENKVPKKLLESKKNEVTGNWRRLLDEELHGMCSSQNRLQTKLNEFSGENGTYGQGERCVEDLGAETDGKRQPGRTPLNGKIYLTL